MLALRREPRMGGRFGERAHALSARTTDSREMVDFWGKVNAEHRIRVFGASNIHVRGGETGVRLDVVEAELRFLAH